MLTSILIFLPLIAGFLLLWQKSPYSRLLALVVTMAQFMGALYAYNQFHLGPETQFLYDMPWISSLGISYKVGMDGISLLMVLLTNILCPLIVLSTTKMDISRPGLFYGLILIMQGALIGVFTSLDAFLYYIFWELTLIPAYFLVLVWGNGQNVRVTYKFFIYTITGSLFMLLGLIYLYQHTAGASFDITDLYGVNLPLNAQLWVFLAFMLAYGIKIPIFPFHTWQPDTYTTAPTAGTMLLSGIMLKMALYSILRWVFPIVPNAVYEYGHYVLILAIIGVVYAAMIAINQKNLKRLFAYSSMSHVGMIAAGLFTLSVSGIQGGLIQMLSHGINAVGLFFICEILWRRTQTNEIIQLGGIRLQAPAFNTFYVIVLLASVALPLTNGFVGEFLILGSLFELNWVYAGVAGLSVILGAVYMLRSFQKVMLGEPNSTTGGFRDLDVSEWAVLVPVTVLIFWIGIYPKPFMELTEPGVQQLLTVLIKKVQTLSY